MSEKNKKSEEINPTSITIANFNEFRNFQEKYLDDSIQIYLARYVHRQSLDTIGKKFKITRQGVDHRIHQLLGQLGQFKQKRSINE